jgi:hypothetical protein
MTMHKFASKKEVMYAIKLQQLRCRNSSVPYAIGCIGNVFIEHDIAGENNAAITSVRNFLLMTATGEKAGQISRWHSPECRPAPMDRHGPLKTRARFQV